VSEKTPPSATSVAVDPPPLAVTVPIPPDEIESGE